MSVVPMFGLGTFRLKGQAVIDSVSTSLELGYRAIDTAQRYGNEAEIGQAIAASAVQRDALFLTTKISFDNHSADKLVPSLEQSLAKLRTDYVDLTLIHWPALKNNVSLAEYMTALADAKEKGLTRQIGVSNFTIALIKDAIDVVGNGEIATNQIELNPYLQNRKLVDFLQASGIHITSYMTLAYGKLLGDPVVQTIAARHNATAAQVALAWALRLGYSVIPSSTKRENLASNLEAQALKLTARDMKEIAALERNLRLINPDHLAPEWD